MDPIRYKETPEETLADIMMGTLQPGQAAKILRSGRYCIKDATGSFLHQLANFQLLVTREETVVACPVVPFRARDFLRLEGGRIQSYDFSEVFVNGRCGETVETFPMSSMLTSHQLCARATAETIIGWLGEQRAFVGLGNVHALLSKQNQMLPNGALDTTVPARNIFFVRDAGGTAHTLVCHPSGEVWIVDVYSDMTTPTWGCRDTVFSLKD